MKLSNNVELLKVGGVSLVLTWDKNNLVLIDTGFPGQADAIIQAVSDAGFKIEKLTHIIITHQDWDHIGCLMDLQRLAPFAKTIAHEEEAPYIDGRKTPIKLAARLEQYDSLPADQRERCDSQKEFYGSQKIVITETVNDGTILSICGGVEIVHTPGHTPGHIMLYLRESRIMVCGDGANIADGKLAGPNPVHTYDIPLALLSLEKMKSYDIHGIVAYHGGYICLE